MNISELQLKILTETTQTQMHILPRIFKMNGSRIILAAHRGDRFNYPENTMPAFESAVNASVDMIETDVRMSKDGELVLMHDRSALRTTGIDKNIWNISLRPKPDKREDGRAGLHLSRTDWHILKSLICNHRRCM